MSNKLSPILTLEQSEHIIRLKVVTKDGRDLQFFFNKESGLVVLDVYASASKEWAEREAEALVDQPPSGEWVPTAVEARSISIDCSDEQREAWEIDGRINSAAKQRWNDLVLEAAEES